MSSDHETTPATLDTLSTAGSETSAAVVSLYNSWSGASLSGTKSSASSEHCSAERNDDMFGDGPGCLTITTTTPNPLLRSFSKYSDKHRVGQQEGDVELLDDEITLLDLEDNMESREVMLVLKQALKKRLRSEQDIPDLPPAPQKRRRKPVCSFLNYMGTRFVPPPKTPPVVAAVVVEEPHLWHKYLGLDETDALFPMAVKANESSSITTTVAAATTAVVTTKHAFANVDDSQHDSKRQEVSDLTIPDNRQ